MEAFQHQRKDVRERGEPLDLHAAARECAQATPAAPVAPAQKRRRVQVEEVPDVDSSTQPPALHPHNSPDGSLEPPSAASNILTAGPTSTLNPPTPATAPSGSRLKVPPTTQGDTPPVHGWVDHETGWYVKPFPDPLAVAPILDDLLPPVDLKAYMWSCGDMGNPDHFDMVELILTTSLKDSAKNRHLKSVLYCSSSFPWENTNRLYTDVDKLRHGPAWHLYKIHVENKQDPTNPCIQYLVKCDIVDIVRDMMANLAFQDLLRYAPVTYWTTEEKTERAIGDMWSADWWPRMQEELRKQGVQDAMIMPLVIATDQTKLSSLCGSQKAYPVYLTLGNIGKEARGQPSKPTTVLLGYLLVDAFEDIVNDDEQRRMKADLMHRVDLVHQAMETMFAPLVAVSKTGVEMCPARQRGAAQCA
ncbi:hypothetical protein FRC06_011403 [Ceratobasidium sp. 370]|nr:hypothetical protein FRC06_011403 [Ceratobasidium sp. 370]